MEQFLVSFNEEDYLATYNSQTGYYEVQLKAPEIGGIYTAEYTITNVFGESLDDSIDIQVLAKEQPKLSMNKVFLWIFDFYTFKVKDIVEISDYELNIDEETNANSFINILRKTNARSRDIVAVKKNNDVVYWGIIDNIENEDGKKLYKYTLKYITNLFNQTIELKTTSRIKNNQKVEDGLYLIRYNANTNKVFDVYQILMDDNTGVFIGNYNNGANQLFGISKQSNGYYKIMAAHSHKYLTVNSEQEGDIVQYHELDDDSQLFEIVKVGTSQYCFISKLNGKYIRKRSTEYLRADGNQTQTDTIFQMEIQSDENYMRYIGIEDFLKREILYNFVDNEEDAFLNLDYIEVIVKSHTPKQTTISNVENSIYNFHTWMTNCTQKYNIVYDFNIIEGKLIIIIETKDYKKEIVDVKAQPISNYSEVFETNIVSKVIVLTSTNKYTLYLLNDRTTTTDITNPNRAIGRTETVYTENYDDAPQKALDTIRANTYNHNITFNYLGRLIKIGTPIAIKTKESLIYDTYISSIKITPKKFIEYICGNIRIGLIEKLNQERNK